MQNVDVIGDRVLKQIDRVYNSVSKRKNAFHITSIIFPGFYLSDHAPIFAMAKSEGPTTKPSVYCMNTSHLDHPDMRPKLLNHWKELLDVVIQDDSLVEDKFYKGLYESRRMCRTFGKDMVEKRRERERLLQALLAAAQLKLESDPNDLQAQTELAEA